ncbi:hypothetical protein [Sphingomonas sp. LY160]|uniref:hypothetical protein n=1 Tax=Sphingomonas sp. LY160 TaxID=3095342 RepID=UPI002ADEC935|nr:hypothetical protein [Sphingomonas sp. LY160]MEA1071760.1 hypothetical protein [Sphingomonas sp. LY160]
MNTEDISGGAFDEFIDPLALSVEQAAPVSNTSRSELYEALGRQILKAEKHDRRALILIEDLRQCLRSLPSSPGKKSSN